MLYNYLKGFDEFPIAREELEAEGVVFVSIATVEDVIQVNIESDISHPDFMVAE